MMTLFVSDVSSPSESRDRREEEHQGPEVASLTMRKKQGVFFPFVDLDLAATPAAVCPAEAHTASPPVEGGFDDAGHINSNAMRRAAYSRACVFCVEYGRIADDAKGGGARGGTRSMSKTPQEVAESRGLPPTRRTQAKSNSETPNCAHPGMGHAPDWSRDRNPSKHTPFLPPPEE